MRVYKSLWYGMPTDTFVGAMSEGLTVNASAVLFEDFKTSYEKSVATTFTLTVGLKKYF